MCDFCKTEYNAAGMRGGVVRCAVCGNTWVVHTPPRRSAILTLFAALCAALAAAVFAVVAITQHQANVVRATPLVASIDEIRTITDDAGVVRFVVDGRVVNRSDEIYGVPDLLIVSYDEDGHIVARQRFMPSATLLDSGASVGFSHTLAVPTSGVKKIAAEIYDNGGSV